ncbi:MAG: hypothetical protein GWP91_26010, partial [Rhodobacterales bacterium]|nr:hypothetical protein [Rhodobacterales bacterium]
FFENFASLDVHRRMLSDDVRVEAYREAIQQLVGSTSVVMDAGTGSGVLATLAALVGAKIVYAVDNSDILDRARVVFEESGFSDAILPIRGDFATVTTPQPVDVIVTETFGILALAEGAAQDLTACCTANLASDGVVCPSAVSLFFAPVIDPAIRDQVVGPFERWQGVNMGSMRQAQLQRGVTLEVPAAAVMGTGECLARLNFSSDAVEAHGTVRFEGTAGCEIVGLVGWFDLQLSPDVVLGTGPYDPLTHWQQCFLPVESSAFEADLEATIHLVPAPEDRRSLEVTVAWRAGTQSGVWRYRLR